MKLREIYDFVVKEGIEADPRGPKVVKETLQKQKKSYEQMQPKQKEEFDKDNLFNPYADTRILCGDLEKRIQTIMLGIDIDVGEVLLADRLNQTRKRPVDLVASHHPAGRAWAGFYEVMNMQTDILAQKGVPVNIAEGVLEERIKEVERKVHPSNHARAQDAARLLNIAFMSIHTPADNHVTVFLQRLMDKKKPQTVKEVIEILKELPEYKEAVINKAGPKVVSGKMESRAGKIMVDMTGGTEGSKEIFKELAKAGVGTIVGMHLSDDHIKMAHQERINVIIAGHIASDSIGLNLLLDKLCKKGKIDIIPCSGFIRVRR